MYLASSGFLATQLSKYRTTCKAESPDYLTKRLWICASVRPAPPCVHARVRRLRGGGHRMCGVDVEERGVKYACQETGFKACKHLTRDVRERMASGLNQTSCGLSSAIGVVRVCL
eukprot:6206765-Pleurochrysis_carterae.AAC.1